MDMIVRAATALQNVFGACADVANEVSKVIQRQRKFTPQALAQAFVLALLQNPRANCEDIASMAAAGGMLVSHQAVEQRYSPRLVEFFKVLFQQMTRQAMSSDTALAPLLERFTEVILIDSSVVTLPDSQEEDFRGCGGSYEGGKSALKLQTELNLRDGNLRCVQIEQGRAPDGASDRQNVTPTPGSLRIADLGYFNIPVLAGIDESKAFFLTRLPHPTKIFVAGEKHNVITWLNSRGLMIVDEWIETGAEARLKCRLIAWRVPEEIANRRRQKLSEKTRSKTGRPPSAESLVACDWELVMTNLPADQLSVKEAIVLYRSRWQIELLFKRWKSICLIDELDGRNDVVTMVRFWARLCAAIIQHWLTVSAAWSGVLHLSFTKVARLVRQFAKDIAIAISSNGDLTLIIERCGNMAQAGCKRNRRRKHPGTIELLRNPELLDYTLKGLT